MTKLNQFRPWDLNRLLLLGRFMGFIGSLLVVLSLIASAEAFARQRQGMDCPQGLEAFSQGLHKKLRKDCAYCHGGQGPGPSHSVEDPKASYKMIKNLLNLSNPVKLDGLSDSKFITTGSNHHCASMGVECNTSSEELMGLVKPWIETEIKSCSVATTKLITSEKTSVLTKGKVTLKIPGYDQVQVQAILDTHVASDVTRGYVKLKNFKICHPNAQVTVRGIKILIDGEEDNYATLKERTFEPCNQELNPETLLFSAQNSPTTQQSRIEVQVDSLTVGPMQASTNCQYPQYYNEVITPLIQSSCLNCHNQNNSPLTCKSLIETYRQSGSISKNIYFKNGRFHPKTGINIQTEVLDKYFNLETRNNNNFTENISKVFDKIKNILRFESPSENQNNYITVFLGRGGHACALNEITHQAKCWGNNSSGQLGYEVRFTTSFKYIEYLAQNNIKELGIGASHTCALLNDGTAKCWGENDLGQLGYGYTDNYKFLKDVKPLPLINIKQLLTGSYHTCALFNDGTAKCWGENRSGQLGSDDVSPYKLLEESQTLPLNNIKQLVAGRSHTCALLNDGTAKCWGGSMSGQLGIKTYVINKDGFAVLMSKFLIQETALLALDNIKQLVAGSSHTCALFNDGTAKCWGSNEYGQLGNGDVSSSKLLEESQTLPLNNIKQLVAGRSHTCALLNDGTAKCWGSNEYGQIGNGDVSSYKLLEESQTLPLDNIKQLAAGSSHTCAVLELGQIKCWGENDSGQLGYDDRKNRDKPDLDDVPFFPLLEFFK